MLRAAPSLLLALVLLSVALLDGVDDLEKVRIVPTAGIIVVHSVLKLGEMLVEDFIMTTPREGNHLGANAVRAGDIAQLLSLGVGNDCVSLAVQDGEARGGRQVLHSLGVVPFVMDEAVDDGGWHGRKNYFRHADGVLERRRQDHTFFIF